MSTYKKRTYTLKVPQHLVDMGFPAKFKGRNSVKKSINKFVKENKEALVRYYHPNDEELDEVGRVQDHTTWREICTKQVQGYEYVYEKGCNVGTFRKGVWYSDEDKALGNLIERAKSGLLTSTDFLSYTHSKLRYNFDRVGSAIINKATDKLIRGNNFFKLAHLFRGGERVESIVEFGITLDLWHRILDDIIFESKELIGDDPMQEVFIESTIKQEELLSELEREEIDLEEYKEESFMLRKELFNLLFESNSSYRTRAEGVDRARDYQWNNISCTMKSKSIRLMFCLIDEGTEPTKYEEKEAAVLAYYEQNPSGSLRTAATELGISINTVRKYKKA